MEYNFCERYISLKLSKVKFKGIVNTSQCVAMSLNFKMSSDIRPFSREIDTDTMCPCYHGFRLLICGPYDELALASVTHDNDNAIIMHFPSKIR